MTTTVGVFDDFVRVRWGDLEAAVRLVVLDPDVAREVTAEALARLRSEWSTTTEEGRPVERARRLALSCALARVSPTHGRRGLRRPSPSGRPPAAPAPDDDDPPPWMVEADDPDPAVAALVEHLRGLDPLDRALLAGRQVWDARPDEVARLLDLPPVELRERDRASRAELAQVHAAALPDESGPATPWGFDDDLARAVDVVLRGLTDPPDPAALVGARARRARRRTLVLAGAAAAAVAGTGVAVAWRDPVAATSPGAVPSPTDRVWASTSVWPARGPLAGDPWLRTFVAGRARLGDRILWAGDLATRRIVLVRTRHPEGFSASETALRLFSGRRGTEVGDLDELLPPHVVIASTDTVAVALPDGPEQDAARSLLVVLARPTVVRGAYSRMVRPTAAGDLRRVWTDLALVSGVGTTVLDAPAPAALRVSVDGFGGAPVTVASPYEVFERMGRGEVSPADGIDRFIELVTAIPVSWLRTEVVSDDRVASGLFDPSLARDGEQARVLSLRTTTPDGAVLRSTLHVEVDRSVFPVVLARLVPAGEAEHPSLVQGTSARPGVSRFLVVHPPVATVQLVSARDDEGFPRSPVLRTRGRGATVVDVVTEGLDDEFRIVLEDPPGRIVHDEVPAPGRYLTDG